MIARSSDNTIAIYRTPQTSAAAGSKPLKAKLYSSHLKRRIIAAGTEVHKAAAALLSVFDSGHLQFEMIGGPNNGKKWIVNLPFKCSDESLTQPELSICTASPEGSRRILAVVDQRLIEFDLTDSPPIIQATVEVNKLKFIKQLNDTLIFGAHGDSVISWAPFRGVNKTNIDKSEQVLVGTGGSLAHKDFGLLALQSQDNFWSVRDAKEQVYFGMMAGKEVMAVVGVWSHDSPGLIVIDQNDKRRISIIGKDWNVELPSTADEITCVDVNVNGEIAYTSQSGELVIFSISSGLQYQQRMVSE